MIAVIHSKRNQILHAHIKLHLTFSGLDHKKAILLAEMCLTSQNLMTSMFMGQIVASFISSVLY